MNLAHLPFRNSLMACIGCASLLLIWSRYGWTQDANAVDQIKELQKQRVVELEEAFAVATDYHRSAREPFEIVYIAGRDLSAARLAAAENQQERIKAYDATIENLKGIIEIQVKLVKASRVTSTGLHVAKGFLLETQLERLRAMARR